MAKKKSKIPSGRIVVRNRPYGVLIVLVLFLAVICAIVPQHWIWCFVVIALALVLTFLIKNYEVLEITPDSLTLYLRDDSGNVDKRCIATDDLISWSVHDDNNRLRISYYDRASSSAKMQILSTANLMGVSRQLNKYFRGKLNSKLIAGQLAEKLHGFRIKLFGGKKK